MESNYLIYLAESAVLTVILGFFAIPLLKKLKARQSIREEGPKSHRIKSGTPTMGGLFMLLSAVLVVIFNKMIDPSVLWLLFLTLGHGLLGFLDDFIKAEKKRNLGLTAKQKMLGQIILAVLFCWGVVDTLHLPYSIAIPFTHTDISIGLLYYPFVVLVIVGASNAVNLTDGLDGLASGCCVIAFSAYAMFCYMTGFNDLGYFIIILAGSCIGFLFFNYHPANIHGGYRFPGPGRCDCRYFRDDQDRASSYFPGPDFCAGGSFCHYPGGFLPADRKKGIQNEPPSSSFRTVRLE